MAANSDENNTANIVPEEAGEAEAAAEKASTEGAAVYDNSQSLVDIANNTFKELCKTLENEQTKLIELEERRKKLQEEMQRLKLEIEEEKHTYRLSFNEVVAHNPDLLNSRSSSSSLETPSTVGATSGSEDADAEIGSDERTNSLYTCYEVDEGNDEMPLETSTAAMDDAKKLLDAAEDHLQRQLQNAVTDGVLETMQGTSEKN